MLSLSFALTGQPSAARQTLNKISSRVWWELRDLCLIHCIHCCELRAYETSPRSMHM